MVIQSSVKAVFDNWNSSWSDIVLPPEAILLPGEPVPFPDAAVGPDTNEPFTYPLIFVPSYVNTS